MELVLLRHLLLELLKIQSMEHLARRVELAYLFPWFLFLLLRNEGSTKAGAHNHPLNVSLFRIHPRKRKGYGLAVFIHQPDVGL
jgi:hypothetical protein